MKRAFDGLGPEDCSESGTFLGVELINPLVELKKALEYISNHDWASEKRKWGNEFVSVSKEALKVLEESGWNLEAIPDLITALEEIKAHGCCVMHNDSGCPGCIAKEALEKWKGEK